MKKISLWVLSMVFVFVIVGCGSTAVSEKPMSNQTSVASLSYISSGLMEAEIALYESNQESSMIRFLVSNFMDAPETTTAFEGELEFINIYMDKLKLFMDDGFDSIDVEEEISDREEYSFMSTFVVEEENYTIYYNIDTETEEITGVLIYEEIEYELEITDNSEEEDGEIKNDLIMTATKEDDYIITHVRSITEEGESKQVISIEKSISGVESELEIIIKEDIDSTFSVEISDGVNEYKFKVETTDEGKHYKLDYEIDGVKGFVLINEMTDDEGEIYYRYKIQEAGKDKEIDKEKPENKGNSKDKGNPNA